MYRPSCVTPLGNSVNARWYSFADVGNLANRDSIFGAVSVAVIAGAFGTRSNKR